MISGPGRGPVPYNRPMAVENLQLVFVEEPPANGHRRNGRVDDTRRPPVGRLRRADHFDPDADVVRTTSRRRATPEVERNEDQEE